MRRNVTLLLIVVLILGTTLLAPVLLAAEATAGKPVAAVVNGQEITRDEIADRLLSYYGNSLLDSMIADAVLDQEAKRRNITVSEAETDAAVKSLQKELNIAEGRDALEGFLKAQGGASYAAFRHQAQRFALMEKLFADKVQVTDKDAEDIYNKNKLQYLVPDMIQVRMCTLPSEERANAALARLRKGEDFEKVAQEMMQDPGEGKILPPYYRGKGRLSTSIESALFAASVGSLQGPFKEGGVYHIFRVEQKVGQHQISLEEAKDDLKKALRQEKVAVLRSQIWPKWIDDQLKAAKVERKLTF